MKILIVDDEIEKANEIAKCLGSQVEGIDFVHLTTALAARQHLRTHEVDLLVVDLNLPANIGEGASAAGGFDFIEILQLDSKCNLPHDVIFITARDELVSEAIDRAHGYGAILLEYSKRDSWSRFLCGRVKRLSKKNDTGVLNKVDIAIVTALGNPELEHVLKLGYEWAEMRMPADPTVYYVGRFIKDGREISVLATSANRKGMPSSAALATKVAIKFNPTVLAMLGICAGIKHKTNYGDIIVADPTWDYGSGKYAVDGEGSSVFLAAPFQCQLDMHVRGVAEQLARDPTITKSISASWNGDVPQGKLAAKIGPMASGASVIADDAHARAIALQQRELLAIEMEAYAVMAAAEQAKTPKTLAIVIKSVCDYADSEKSDSWQAYASHTSAHFADALFRHKDFTI